MTHGLNSHVTKGKELKAGKAEEKKQESTRVSGREREGVKCQVSSVTVSDAAVRIRSRMNKKGGPAVAPKHWPATDVIHVVRPEVSDTAWASPRTYKYHWALGRQWGKRRESKDDTRGPSRILGRSMWVDGGGSLIGLPQPLMPL